MQKTSLLRLLPLLVLLLFMGGCASLRRDGRLEPVLVQSEPSGASILVNGKSAGLTPAFVLLARGNTAPVELQTAAGAVRVPILSHYRWSESFAPNFIFFTLAPLGWAVDLLSGAAWELETPKPVKVELGKTPPPASLSASSSPSANPSQPKIAIAPPLAEQLAVSDDAAKAVQTEITTRFPSARILPFEKTLPAFLANGYDFDNAPAREDRSWLYYTLGVNTIIESRVETEDDHLTVKTQKLDAYTNKVEPGFSLALDPNDKLAAFYTKKTWWSRLLPDTLAVDFVNSNIQVTQGDQTYQLQQPSTVSWWVEGLDYLGALNITNLPPRRYGRAAHFTFSLIPLLRFSRREVKASGLPTSTGESSDQEYTRWLISGGYGPEFGWQISRHYLYVDLLPILYWSEISWNTRERANSITNTGLGFGAEFGYVFYYNSSWNLRLFSRSQNEDTQGWTEALSDRLPRQFIRPSSTSTSVATLVSGVSIGYRFEPGAHVRKVQP